MVNLLLWATLAATGIAVDVQTLAGDAAKGDLTAIRDNTLVLATPASKRTIAFAEVLGVRQTGVAAGNTGRPTAWVELLDGSKLPAAKVTVAGGTASVETTAGITVSVATRSIHHVRTRDHAGEPEFAKQWLEMLKEKPTGDTIIIRRAAGLDQLSGVLHDVGPDSLQFELDGNRIDVKREKLDGWIYYHPTERQLPTRICRLTDAGGCLWNVQSLAMAEQRLEVTSVAGVKFTLPVEQLRDLDFSTGKAMYLSDIEPESSSWRPYLKSRLPEELLGKLFQVKRDRGPDGQALLLGGKSYAKGLSIPSRTELTYRLTDEFRQFSAMVGIDDSVRDGGNVDLVITGDDKELFKQRITGRDEPLPLSLDLTGVRRLKILVDFGGELDIADHLNLCEARISK